MDAFKEQNLSVQSSDQKDLSQASFTSTTNWAMFYEYVGYQYGTQVLDKCKQLVDRHGQDSDSLSVLGSAIYSVEGSELEQSSRLNHEPFAVISGTVELA